MNAQATLGHGLVPEHIIQSMKDSEGARQLKKAPIVRRFKDSPLVDAFCNVFGPVVYWLGVPSNSLVALATMITAPIIVIVLLPFFIVLIPILIVLTSAGVAAASGVGATHTSSKIGNPAPPKSDLDIMHQGFGGVTADR
jgi:hypothetical protein